MRDERGAVRIGGGFIAAVLLIIVLLVAGQTGWAIGLAVALLLVQFIV